MKFKLSIAFALIAGTVPAIAQEHQLTGPEIEALLPTITAIGATSQQTFSASGRTDYSDNGTLSSGKWWVTSTQYCSTWPPSESRVCYDVFLTRVIAGPNYINWVGDSGRRLTDRIIPKDQNHD